MIEIGSLVDKVATWNPIKEKRDTSFFYIDLSSVDKDKKIVDVCEVGHIFSKDAPSRARQLVKNDDVLVATVRPNLNGVALVQSELDGSTASTGYCVLRASVKKLDSTYLFYWVQTVAFISDMMSKATGANYPAVSDKTIKESKIPLPYPDDPEKSLKEQKRIAAILDKADGIRRKRQQAIQLADDFLRSVFLDMFGDPVTNPKGWEVKPLSDVVKKDSVITYGIVQAGEYVESGVPYIRTGDFKFGRLAKSGYARTHPDIAAKFERSKVSTGDLVYCIRASIGAVDIVPEYLDGANLTQGTAKISCGQNVTAEFLVELLRSKGFKFWIDRYSKGATFKEITLGKLRESPVVVPPIKLQNEFSLIRKKILNELKGKMFSGEQPVFEALSQKAFKGEL